EKLLERYPWLAFLPPLLLLLVIALIGALFGLFAAVLAAIPGVALAIWLWNLLRKWASAARLEHSITEESQTPASVAELPTSPDFVITAPGTELGPREGGSDSVEAARFKDGLRDVYTFTQHQFPEPVRPVLALPRLTSTVVASLHPSVTLPRRIKTIIHLP